MNHGGRIVAETMDPYQTHEPRHFAYHARNRTRGRMPGQIRMRVRYKAIRTPWFDYLFVSPAELAELLNGTGWRVAELIRKDGPGYVAILAGEARSDTHQLKEPVDLRVRRLHVR